MGHSFTGGGGGDGGNGHGHGGHGHGGNGHGGHGHQSMGGHPDQGALWNSALQGVGGKGKPLTRVPARTFLPIIVAIVAFLAMMIPFAINWDEVEAARREEELKAQQGAGQGATPDGQSPQSAQQAYGQIPGQAQYGQMPGQQYGQGSEMQGQMPNQAMMAPTAGQLATQPAMQSPAMQAPAAPMANYAYAPGQTYGQPAYAPGQYYGQQPYAAPYDASGQLSALSGHSNRLESSGHMSPHNHLAQPKFKVFVAR